MCCLTEKIFLWGRQEQEEKGAARCPCFLLHCRRRRSKCRGRWMTQRLCEDVRHVIVTSFIYRHPDICPTFSRESHLFRCYILFDVDVWCLAGKLILILCVARNWHSTDSIHSNWAGADFQRRLRFQWQVFWSGTCATPEQPSLLHKQHIIVTAKATGGFEKLSMPEIAHVFTLGVEKMVTWKVEKSWTGLLHVSLAPPHSSWSGNYCGATWFFVAPTLAYCRFYNLNLYILSTPNCPTQQSIKQWRLIALFTNSFASHCHNYCY